MTNTPLKLVTEFGCKNNRFFSKNGLGEDLDIKLRADGTVFIINHQTGVGVKGKALLISAVKEIANNSALSVEESELSPHFKWTWAWNLEGFAGPKVEKSKISDWLKSNAPSKLESVNIHSIRLVNSSQEMFLRAACARAYRFKYVCEFAGPTEDAFVIGLTKSRFYKMNELEFKQLSEITNKLSDTPEFTSLGDMGVNIAEINIKK